MRTRSLAFVAAVLAAFFSPAFGSQINAQSLPIVFQQTVSVQYGQSQTLNIPLTAGVTYYFTAASNVGSGYNTQGDSVIYLFNPAGAQVGYNDDWGGSGWNTTLLGPAPTNGYSSLITYTATVTGTFTLRVQPYPWSGVQFSPFPVVVYGTSGGSSGGGGTIPNVRLDPRPALPDSELMMARSNSEMQRRDVTHVQQHGCWVASPSRG